MPLPRGNCQLNYARERMWEPGYLKVTCNSVLIYFKLNTTRAHFLG